MPKIIQTQDGCIHLPKDFIQRRRLPDQLEYWLDERGGDLILHPRLPDIRKLYIEPTTACNLRCRTCIRNIWDDPVQHMSPSTFANLIAGLKDLPELKRAVFTSFGEPLVNPRLLDMIAAVREHGLAVTLGSNGLLLNRKIAAELVTLGVDRVMVSIDGGKPETFAGVRGAMLSQVIENIRLLNETKAQLGSLYPSIGIEFVALCSNVAELGDLTKMAAELNVSRLLVSHVLAYSEEMLPEMLYSYSPMAPLKANGWPLRLDAWVSWGVSDLPRMHWGADRRCRFVGDHAASVGWDGGVSPCYALAHNYSYFTIDRQKKQVRRYLLGDVNQRPLREIWMDEEYVRFRSQVNAFYFPSCPDCDLRESCDLRQRNEGCWGWNPSCADCLWAQDIVRCP